MRVLVVGTLLVVAACASPTEQAIQRAAVACNNGDHRACMSLDGLEAQAAMEAQLAQQRSLLLLQQAHALNQMNQPPRSFQCSTVRTGPWTSQVSCN